MIYLASLILTSFLLGLARCDLPQKIVSTYNGGCASDFMTRCNLQCANGNYVLDDNGCPTCVCATTCPEIKCRANCGDAGYVRDENGCQTCKCVSKAQCPRTMCRMFCENGFRRDENGCEYCACNETPQPCPILNCEHSCPNGYRKDYSGCQTCDCEEQQPKQPEKKICSRVMCDKACQYGYKRDEDGCEICSCNQCPLAQCRMYCLYGFRKNNDGCEICECDWTPVAEKIQCDARIPCSGTYVCNQDLRLCEAVSADRINWFQYNFEVENGNELFKDAKFIRTFKNGLIHNIAAKYGFNIGQIAVSSVEENGLTSFQIMPYFNENMNDFDSKIDQVDIDLNSHEFRALLPAVVDVISEDNGKAPAPVVGVRKWCEKIRNLIQIKSIIIIMIIIIVLIALIVGMGYVNMRHRYKKLSICSDSKTQICSGSYQLATNDDEFNDFGNSDGFKQMYVTNNEPISKDKTVSV